MQGSKILSAIQRGLGHRFLPVILAAVAFIIMLPATNSGLVMDDLLQRTIQLKSEPIPSRLYDTGIVPEDSGRLSAVLFDLFGFNRKTENTKLAKDYGTLPWWVPDSMKASLWRPFTALTHWLDYRLYPDSPAAMHTHNIVWFAAVIFLVTIIYRKITGTAWVAGFAAVLFLLDKNTYFPVMFIANRGFIVSLCFGLLCLYTFYKWRTTTSGFAAVLSVVFLAMSLLSNEAGVSTFAFVLAYALVLDKASWRSRILSLLPSIIVIVVWRVIYQLSGYGISGMGEYIDPGHEPLRFLSYVPGHATAVIAGQLSGLAPDIMMAVNAHLFKIIMIFYIVFACLAITVFIPLIRKDTIARFWFAVMIFATIPVVSVPSGKNFGFVETGAFGLIAIFVAGLLTKQSWIPKSLFYKISAWVICVILIFAHIPSAIAGRIMSPGITSSGFTNGMKHMADIRISPNANNQDVIVVNVPCSLSLAAAPFYKAYYGKPIPKTLKALTPSCAALEVTRTDDRTLVIKSEQQNIFASDQRSPMHFSHLFAAMNYLFVGNQKFREGGKYSIKGMTVEVLAVDSKGLPKELSFRFDTSLDDPNLYWVKFDWSTFSYKRFEVPQVGQTVSISGPPYVSLRNALRAVLGNRSNK